MNGNSLFRLALLGFGLFLNASLLAADDESGSSLNQSQCVRQNLYVASLTGEITAYNPDANGSVKPVRRIAGSLTQLQDSWAVAFNREGQLFVQNFIGASTTNVFGPDVAGNVLPLRVFRNVSGGRDASGIAVDSKGNVYVTRITSGGSLDVFPPNANGFTNPIRTLQIDGNPTSVTVDSNDNIIVAVLGPPTGNAIEVFTPTAQQPLRRISGPATGLGSSMFYQGAFFVVNYSPFTGRIYTATSGDTNPAIVAHVSVFPGNGNGDIRPIRTISGSNTLLGESISGLASDQQTGEIFVLSTNSRLSTPTMVHVYGRYVNGNLPPLRSFSDRTSGLMNARGIAFER
jgi:hypothetical protein